MMKRFLIIGIVIFTSCSEKSKTIEEDYREKKPQSWVDFYTFIAKYNYEKQTYKYPKFKNKIQKQEFMNRRNDSIAKAFKQEMLDYIDTWGWEINNWTGIIDKLDSYGGLLETQGEDRIYVRIKGFLSYPNSFEGPTGAKKSFRMETKFHNTSSQWIEASVTYPLVDQYDSGILQNKGAYIPRSYNWDKDKTWGLIIEKGSKVYNQVINLAEGDRVYFSGKFLPNDEIRNKKEYLNDMYKYPMNNNKLPVFGHMGRERFAKWEFHISITDIKKQSEYTAVKNESGELELTKK